MLLGDGMARAYSSDLRIRVIRAVEGGFSARGAGRRLRIGESTATAWVGRWRRTGSAEAKSQKGRSRSTLKPHAAWLFALIGERADLTLEEVRGLLGERGVRVGASSVWRFFDRHGIRLKKKCTPPSSNAPTWRRRGGYGKTSSRSLIHAIWCFLTRPARRPTWLACAGAAEAVPA
jgi:transposase